MKRSSMTSLVVVRYSCIYVIATRDVIEERFTTGENACTDTAKTLAIQLEGQCQEFYEALKGFKEV